MCSVVGCASTPSPAPPAPTVEPTPVVVLPADFGFEFESGACYFTKLDTFDNTLSRSDVPDTAMLSLSQADLTTIFRKMMEINLLSYPVNFAIPTPESGMITTVIPAMHYTFRVRMNGEFKRVFWYDNIVEPTTPEAERLRDLASLIQQVIATYPAAEQLPTPKFGCA